MYLDGLVVALHLLFAGCCLQAARPCLQAAGSLNFNFLMTSFLALKLSGSITHFFVVVSVEICN